MLPSVAFSPASRDACALYRTFIPHLHTPGSKYLLRDGPMPVAEYQGMQVAVVQRLFTVSNAKAIEVMRNMGIKVIYDLDDNMWDVPASNPGRQALVKAREGFEACASISNVLTVSTAALKVAVHKNMKRLPKGMNVIVCPNAIDFNLFAQSPRREKPYFRVGWAGTNTHAADVRQVFNQLPDLLKNNANIELEFVGLPAPEAIKNNERVRERDFVPVGEYPARLPSWHWDLLLAPIDDNAFNRSKSNIKLLEAAAIGVPALCSDVASYRDFCSQHKELEYLLCRKPSDWTKKIVQLSNEPQYCSHLASIMYAVARDNFDIAKTVGPTWHTVFSSLL